MARKSNAAIAAAEAAKLEEINRKAEERLQAMLPAIVAGLVGELGKVRADLGPNAAPVTAESQITTKSVLEGLAHAMAKAADPANKRRILAPEIVEERALAREEMKRAILQFHAKGDVPIYQVVRTTFLNQTLIQPQFQNPVTKAMDDQEIDWPGVPNQALLPVSDSAKEIHAHYLKSIGARAGHVLMGFQKVDGEIEQRAVPLSDLEAPIVLSGKEIRRGHAGAPRGAEMSISDSLSADPRRGNPAARPKTQNILGTTAAPAVVS